MSRRGWLLFAAMCVLWGVPYLFIRVAVREVPPGVLVFLRTGIGGLALLPFAVRADGARDLARRWRPLVAYSIVEIAGPFLLLGSAERHQSSSLTGLLIAAVPLVGLLAARVGGSRDVVDRWRWVGLLLGLAGVAVLLGLDVGSVHAAALIETGLAVLGYAVGPLVLTRWLADLPVVTVVCASLAVVTLGYLPYAVTAWPSSVSAKPAWSVLALALLCTALAFVGFVALIAEIGPSRATVITYVNPAVAVLLGVLVLGEPVTAGIVVGFPLILVGSVLATRDQSMRTSPRGVSKTAATTPVSPSKGDSHSTSIPSSG